jgi:hypothetical protein
MITGNLVGLRAVEREDLISLREWRNYPEFRRNFREVRELSLADQEQWFDNLQKTKHINYMFAIVRLSDNKIIGAAGLLYINWFIRSADFSFYIGENKSYIDQDGYAEDAVHILLDYGFNYLNLHKIWMELYEYDKKKLEFFQEVFDFKVDGKLRDNCFDDGKYWDSLIISKIESAR